jgi:hypothetical protein
MAANSQANLPVREANIKAQTAARERIWQLVLRKFLG